MEALWTTLWTPVWTLLAAPLLDYGFMRNALAVVVIVGITSSVLSCLLVVRRQALMGDAISHSVLLGVVLGWMLGRHAGVFWGALASGILSGIAITYVERNSRVKLDAAMGVFFTFAFALGLAIISMVRPTGIDLFHVLFGNVLGVGREELTLTALCGALVLGTLLLFYRGFHLWSFDEQMARAAGVPTGLLHYLFIALLSATIVASLQAVGLILVIAMLVTPGATAYLLSNRLSAMMAIAAAVGLLASVTGLYGSYYLDVASGPAMVIMVSACFGAAFLFAPQQGVLARARARRRQQRVSLDEDVLRAVVILDWEFGKQVDARLLSERLAAPVRTVRAALRRLRARGLLQRGGEPIRSTPKGVDSAAPLVRPSSRHRELPVRGRGLRDGRPSRCRRGTGARYRPRHPRRHAAQARRHRLPIPTDTASRARAADLRPVAATPLTELETGTAGRIAMLDDDRSDILLDLAERGLLPKAPLRVVGTSKGSVQVSVAGQETELSPEQARRVFVTPMSVAPAEWKRDVEPRSGTATWGLAVPGARRTGSCRVGGEAWRRSRTERPGRLP